MTLSGAGDSGETESKPATRAVEAKVIASCFFEASTRTRLSFEIPCTAWVPAWWASPTAPIHHG